MFCLCFWVLFEIVDHGSCQGNMAWVLSQWQHLVASYEATDVLHQTICITLYCPSGMAIKIVVSLPAFFAIVDSVVTHNHS